jgi:tetratricopeptide (TPR) repeat protein
MILTRLLLLCSLLPLLVGFDLFHSKSSLVEEGNRLLAAGKLKEALAAYERAAKELPDELGVQYNLGIAHHQLGQFERARDALTRATQTGDRELRARAFYNLGNAQFELKKWRDAVGAYTRALQLNPRHQPSKWNLELALRRLREEEKKKQQQDKKDKKQDKKDKKQDKKDKKDQKQDKKDQDQKQSKKDDKDKKQGQDRKQDRKDQKQAQKQERKEQAKPKPQPQPKEMQGVLDALDRNDRNLQRKRARAVMGGGLPRPTKDW